MSKIESRKEILRPNLFWEAIARSLRKCSNFSRKIDNQKRGAVD